ncbi:MAG: Asp-tRNA(Asn)/Glu-tRNA(Gln) amidotransferase subunit GatB [Saprospiraceae bacterium]
MNHSYETIIGLEVHVQLATHSKAFCGDDARFGGDPNTHVSTISLGHPGTLPRLNKRQIEFAVRLGLALGCDINLHNAFDRKNYFYADLPKGYQITQDRLPICVGGTLNISTKDGDKAIRIHHIHMEEDAGKSMHEHDPFDSLIDLNRAGVPLLEIVTEPDLRSADEVDAFMTGMRQLVRYLEVSDGNMEEGSLRCDCNVSIRKKGDTKLNERCEIKNLNSMRFARKAIDYEVNRQIKIMEAGGKVEQETLNFDPETGVTTPLRSKEDAHDYRYFPEPDLPPVVLSSEYILQIKENLPPLPWTLQMRFKSEYGLSDYDAHLLTEEKETALFYLNLCNITKNYKAAANLIINKILPWCKETAVDITQFPVSFSTLANFIHLIDSSKVSNSNAYQRIFPELVAQPTLSPEYIAKKLNLIQSADTDFLAQIVEEVITKYPEKVAEYRKGKKGLLGFFVGEVMKQSKGKAEPKTTNALLLEKLG